MSIFTKIFVVLVMLMSVVLVALVVPFVVNSDTFRTAYEQERQLRQTAQKASISRDGDITRALQSHQETINNLEAQKAQLQAQIGDKDATIQRQQAEVVRLTAQSADYATNVARLSTSLDQYSKINDQIQAEVVERRTKQLDAEKKLIETNQALRTRTTEVETLVSQTRLFKEQIDDLSITNQEMMQQLKSAAPVASTEEAPAPAPEKPIRGSITNAKMVGDDWYIGLSVGANDNVAEGMAFMLHRGKTYLGDAVIEKVDLNQSVARVTLKAGDLNKGDQAMAGGL